MNRVKKIIMMLYGPYYDWIDIIYFTFMYILLGFTLSTLIFAIIVSV